MDTRLERCVRLPPELSDQLREHAERWGVSGNAIIVWALRAAFGEYQATRLLETLRGDGQVEQP